MEFWQALWFEIGIDAPQAVGVVLASCVLYLAFTTVLRVWGQRIFANRSGSGLAVVLVLGAIVGRSMLGPSATLLGGLLCLTTLIALEGFFGSGRRAGLIGHRRAALLYAHGELDQSVVQRYHLSESMIWARLRQAGVRNVSEVEAVVLETDGTLSVLRAGEKPDAQLLHNVRGAERLLS